MKRSPLFSALCACLAALLAAPALATCGGGGGGGMGGIAPPAPATPRVYYVPWKVVETPDSISSDSLMTVYWFPRSADEARSSDLTTSRILTEYSAQCVAMALVRSENGGLRAQYEVPAGSAAVVLVSGDDVVERIDEVGKARDVERAIRNVVKEHAKELESRLDQAKTAAEKGAREKALHIYSQVLGEKCLFPKQARSARKALEKLGISKTGSLDESPSPMLDPETNERMVAMMTTALKAEESGDYMLAKRLYTEAHGLDPGDPVPLRFLGELERHHTGEWDQAKLHFEEILGMRADPLSIAVALHGLGKMTIHGGEFEKGLTMFEQSVAAYPLALTYRNLAVYWSSEGEREKAMGYVRQAMALDPEDPYNIVFAATFLAGDGRADEAMEIARDYQDLLPASYNLAAIYALSGARDKALALLRRHFYEYERFHDVRKREMWEARADIVFASLEDDPEFVELTRLAD